MIQRTKNESEKSDKYKLLSYHWKQTTKQKQQQKIRGKKNKENQVLELIIIYFF